MDHFGSGADLSRISLTFERNGMLWSHIFIIADMPGAGEQLFPATPWRVTAGYVRLMGMNRSPKEIDEWDAQLRQQGCVNSVARLAAQFGGATIAIGCHAVDFHRL